MFSNYQNIKDNYTPTNLYYKFPVLQDSSKLLPRNSSKPYEEYDAKGNLIGYSWYYGETLKLDFSIDGEIVVESDAIRYNIYGEYPDSSVEGYVGQKAYNIVELKSWTCTAADKLKDNYVWTIDEEFEHDSENATESIYVSAKNYLSDKTVVVKFLNFRHDVIHTERFFGSPNVVVTVDDNLSKKFKKGVYYCEMTVETEFLTTPIFGSKDCILVVK